MNDLRQVRQYLTDEAAILAANVLVSSHLGYCNSLFRSLSSFQMCKLQSIQNTLAKIVTNRNKYIRTSPILKPLHWHPVEFRCIFKTATLVYKFFHSYHPSYLVLFCLFIMKGKRFLKVRQFYPCVHKSKKLWPQLFFDAPTVWNDLPDEVPSAPTVACFRKRLKLHLFIKAFPT